jgi:hypothetical protein
MASQESKEHLRCFGIEFRIVFCLVASIFALGAWSNFKSSLWLSILFFFTFVLSVLLIWLDYSYHVISLTSEGLTFRRIIWKRFGTLSVSFAWNEVEKVSTSTYGFLDLLKSTKIEGKNKEYFTVFSFMEDYLYFLRDVSREAKSAHIDKLTSDLLAGRADV